MSSDKHPTSSLLRAHSRRDFIRRAASGTMIAALGGGYYYLDDRLTRKAQAMTLDDGRPRLPPGQRIITALKPMGGIPGSPRPSEFRLRVSGDVKTPTTFSFAELLALPQVDDIVNAAKKVCYAD